jgi:hypothetical protein
MNTPGFTAKASLYRANGYYHAVGLTTPTDGAIYPAYFVDQDCYSQCYSLCAPDCVRDFVGVNKGGCLRQCAAECRRDCRISLR